MEINFCKYHGCGNDFIVIDYRDDLDFSAFAKNVCQEHIGLGADGIIVVKKDPLEMIFYNADGSRGTMCGNGIRCFAKYCYDNNIAKGELDVLTLAGLKHISLNGELFKVNMGKPSFSTKLLKMNINQDTFLKQKLHNVEVSAVFTGTVHVVVFVKDLDQIVKSDLGEKICNDPIFIDRANVNFVEIIDQENFKVRTFERGVGWTLACGTGATASFVIGNLENKCLDKVNIHFQYGTLLIEKVNEDLYMSGPAKKVAIGTYYYKK